VKKGTGQSTHGQTVSKYVDGQVPLQALNREGRCGARPILRMTFVLAVVPSPFLTPGDARVTRWLKKQAGPFMQGALRCRFQLLGEVGLLRRLPLGWP
jgi:hypothetical protein